MTDQKQPVHARLATYVQCYLRNIWITTQTSRFKNNKMPQYVNQIKAVSTDVIIKVQPDSHQTYIQYLNSSSFRINRYREAVRLDQFLLLTGQLQMTSGITRAVPVLVHCIWPGTSCANRGTPKAHGCHLS